MLIGKTIRARYRLYDQLSARGPSAVYLARDLGTGRIVVLKVLYLEMVAGKLVARFSREVDVLQQLAHPNIVRILDYGLNHAETELPTPISFIVMEYVEGLTLKQIIRRLGFLSPENTAALARQVATALDAMHQRGLIHRDLKSNNIMVTADNLPTIIDFGIVKNMAADEELTGKFTFAGTLSYAAPEQLKDSRNVDIRSDLYALGVVMVECLQGKVPARDRTGRHALIPAEPDETVPVANITANLHKVVERLLSLDPASRFETPAELITALDDAIPNAQVRLPWKLLAEQAAVPDPNPAAPQNPGVRHYLLTERGDRIPLEQIEFVIGRSAPSDDTWSPDLDTRRLDLPNGKTVSRFHCRIMHANGSQYQIIDMGSFNGTWINGRKLPPRTPYTLQNDDRINLGGVMLVYRTEAPTTQPVEEETF